jgi:hypothetical protein
VRARHTRAGIFWELLKHASVAELNFPTKKQKENGSGEWICNATRSDPKHPPKSEASVLNLLPL